MNTPFFNLLLILFTTIVFGQSNDTIALNSVQLTDYGKYKKFRPKFKQKEQLIDHTNQGMWIVSTLLLPKEKKINIKAIEILFEEKATNKNICNTSFYFKPMVLSQVNPVVNLTKEQWFEVEKDYRGKYIFPVDVTIENSNLSTYYIAIETAYDNPFCPEANGYFDFIKAKKNTRVYLGKKQDKSLKEEPVLSGYTLNYRIYYSN